MNEERYFEEVRVGDALPALVKGPIQKVQLVRYAGASGDFNPLHTDDDFARQVGLKNGVIVHGMFVMGCVGQAIGNWIPIRRMKRLNVRFAGMTDAGATLTVTGSVTDRQVRDGENIVTCSVLVTDEKGDVKLSGSFDAALPNGK